MCVLALGIASTYTTEVKDMVTYHNKSGKASAVIAQLLMHNIEHSGKVVQIQRRQTYSLINPRRHFGIPNRKLPLSHLETGVPSSPSLHIASATVGRHCANV